jgi:cobalt/nickel transport system permease protein
MHVGDGILSPAVLAAGGALTLAGTAWGLVKLEYEKVPKAAVLASAFFVVGLIHFPFLGTSAHLLLNGLVGLVLGPAAFPVFLISLLMQALLFMHGGFVTIGVNVVNIALPAVLIYFLFHRLLIKNEGRAVVVYLIGFIAGALSFGLSAALTSLTLYFSNPEKLSATAKIFAVSHIGLVVFEGIVTGSIVSFLIKVKPEIFREKD